MCNGTYQTQWEPTASAYVCAGCYNEFAQDKGWESKPLSIEEKAIRYDALIEELRRLKAESILTQEVNLCADLLSVFAQNKVEFKPCSICGDPAQYKDNTGIYCIPCIPAKAAR
jgi:hypothetical protein